MVPGDYDLRGMERHIIAIEEEAGWLKNVSGGILSVEKNADAILALARLLRNDISDVIETGSGAP
jgi:hypothetical protein